MRTLILGGSGFLGSHVVDKFVAEDHAVVVYDVASERFRRTPRGVRYVSGDLRNEAALESVISSGFDVVLHFISTTTPKSSNESPEFDIQSNVVATVNLLDLCVKHKVGKFVFLSSGGTVYGDIGDTPAVTETHPLMPLCSYGVSKVSIEHYLHVYQHLHGLEYVSLRISNPYGERQSPFLAMGALTVFLYRAINEQTIEIWGDGSATRDFIYAGDVADAVHLAATLPVTGAFNVGSGVGLTLNELLREISQVVGLDPDVERLDARPYDVPRIVLDSTKFQHATGWRATTSLRQGITRTAHWLQHRSLAEGDNSESKAVSSLKQRGR